MNKESVKELIRRRRGQMIVHSCIYYHLNENIVSDDQWQEWANELRDLQHQYPDCKGIDYYDNEFDDWNGDTGAMLPFKDVVGLSQNLLRMQSGSDLINETGINERPDNADI